MGAHTPSANVWYATGTDSGKLDVITATMASSIEDGLGARMTQQELTVGLKASCNPANINGTPIIAPYVIGSGYGQFNNGLDFTGGIATVKTAGQYLVAAMIGVAPSSYGNTRSVVLWVYHNADPVAYCETPMASSFTVSAQATVVLNCVAGDTIYVKASTGGGSVTSVPINTAAYCSTLSVALTQALPL